MVSKLVENTQNFLAYRLMGGIIRKVGEKARRKYEKLGEEIGVMLKKKQKLPENSYLKMDLKWSDEAPSWARKQSLGIEEFKQKYPEHGVELQEMIDKHRKVRRAYLEFGIKEGQEIPEEVYVGIIKELVPDLEEDKSREFYAIVKEIGKKLEVKKKSGKGLDTLLLAE